MADEASIDPDLVKRVAKLAKLADSQSLEQTAAELTKILGYVDQLNSAEIPDSIEPFFGAVEPESEDENAVRSDVVQPSFDRETMLGNTTDNDGEHFLVPPVF
ncbi:MAG: Asp-tRNA(Asn)/Glu-tRNA(Gln) amidotransferase subunit GatC [Planctomycetota bacterium]